MCNDFKDVRPVTGAKGFVSFDTKMSLFYTRPIDDGYIVNQVDVVRDKTKKFEIGFKEIATDQKCLNVKLDEYSAIDIVDTLKSEDLPTLDWRVYTGFLYGCPAYDSAIKLVDYDKKLLAINMTRIYRRVSDMYVESYLVDYKNLKVTLRDYVRHKCEKDIDFS